MLWEVPPHDYFLGETPRRFTYCNENGVRLSVRNKNTYAVEMTSLPTSGLLQIEFEVGG